MENTTFVLLADPQLGENGDCVKNLSALNRALNELGSGTNLTTWPQGKNLSCGGSPMAKPAATFFAGDMCQSGGGKDTDEQSNLTSRNPANYQGGGELRDVRVLYDSWHEDRKGVVGLNKCGNLYFGLGNHDFMDSGGGSGWRYFNNRFSGISDFYRYQMWDFIAQMHTGFSDHDRGPRYGIAPENIDSTKNGSYEWKSHSLNYVVDLGPVDIYQLHRYGGDSVHGRESGLDWLKHKLALKGYKRPVIIVQHFPFSDCYEKDPADSVSELWSVAQVKHLMEVLLPYNVLAVCVGHIHSPRGALPQWIPAAWDYWDQQFMLKDWPNERNTLPPSYKKHPVAEIRPGAAFNKYFALFRLEGERVNTVGAKITKPTTVDILYGTALNSDSDPVNIDWGRTGCSLSVGVPPTLYVRDIEIVFMDKEDENTVLLPTLCTELMLQSANINEGFGGRHVYIRPLFTTNPAEAITRIHAWHTTAPDLGFQDLAQGCSGDHDFRYVKTIRNVGVDPPVTGLFLLRSDQPQKIQDRAGYSRMSPDINEGRKKSCLYFIWRTWTDYPMVLNIVV
ncbi:hypothetical protein BDZ45DRAFT_732564 [Acephala macrosclerotiorum]|nr:hypothetical protein BDZ45DRAFT_732564 [Acephala macrosclerotiorum]